MRRPLGLLGLTLALTSLGSVAPAADAAAGASCSTAITAVDGERRLVQVMVEDDEVTDVEVDRQPLPFNPTGLVYAGTRTLRHGYVLYLNAILPPGVAREVLLTDKDRTDGLTHETARHFGNKGFKPRLLAGSLGYTVFTVDRDTLHRWVRTFGADGRLRFARKVTVPADVSSFTSLQHVGRFEVHGVDTEYLVATTEDGGLTLLTVPFRHPERTRARVLATSGYAGVTEISAGVCHERLSHVVLNAIDPVAGTATWTTIRDIRQATAETTRLRGPVTGADSWDLHAVF